MLETQSYTRLIWKQFKKHPIGLIALSFFILLCLAGIYAPIFCSSKPLLVIWNGKLYFPLFRYLFYQGFFTKPIDLFYNLLMFSVPLAILLWFWFRNKMVLLALACIHAFLFIWLLTVPVKDPAMHLPFAKARQQALNAQHSYRDDSLLSSITPYPGWLFELRYMTDYAKLNVLLKEAALVKNHQTLSKYASAFEKRFHYPMPTLHAVAVRNEQEKKERLEKQLQNLYPSYEIAMNRWPKLIEQYLPHSHQHLMEKLTLERAASLEEKIEFSQTLDLSHDAEQIRIELMQTRDIIKQYRDTLAALAFAQERSEWMKQETQKLNLIIPTLLRSFHWEDDAGGAQSINQVVPWWELTRINRKDLVASLVFGIRVSLIVGMLAVTLALLIGIPLGCCAGYFGCKTDLLISRLIEIWESMPTFFMLLLIIALTQSKSIILVIAALGLFGWTSFARFIRAEVFKQRSLPYVLACQSLGFSHAKTMFSHILPNAIPPVLTLLPFAMMAAISSEAGLSFLGLGEEGATSWGVLMDEGRSVFPAESYLLWPPAILLTIMLVSIALIGDVVRDALDPKLRS